MLGTTRVEGAVPRFIGASANYTKPELFHPATSDNEEHVRRPFVGKVMWDLESKIHLRSLMIVELQVPFLRYCCRRSG